MDGVDVGLSEEELGGEECPPLDHVHSRVVAFLRLDHRVGVDRVYLSLHEVLQVILAGNVEVDVLAAGDEFEADGITHELLMQVLQELREERLRFFLLDIPAGEADEEEHSGIATIT